MKFNIFIIFLLLIVLSCCSYVYTMNLIGTKVTSETVNIINTPVPAPTESPTPTPTTVRVIKPTPTPTCFKLLDGECL